MPTLLTMALLIAALLLPLARPDPGIIRTPYGIYANPSDDTGQCLSAPYDYLCIGNEYSARNEAWLRETGITHIVSAIGQIAQPLDNITYLWFEVDDSDVNMFPYWADAHQFIAEARKTQTHGHLSKIFVHCAAGVSRSSSTIIYHLIAEHDLSYEQALRAVHSVRPVVRPNQRFERDLRNRAAYDKYGKCRMRYEMPDGTVHPYWCHEEL